MGKTISPKALPSIVERAVREHLDAYRILLGTGADTVRVSDVLKRIALSFYLEAGNPWSLPRTLTRKTFEGVTKRAEDLESAIEKLNRELLYRPEILARIMTSRGKNEFGRVPLPGSSLPIELRISLQLHALPGLLRLYAMLMKRQRKSTGRMAMGIRGQPVPRQVSLESLLNDVNHLLHASEYRLLGGTTRCISPGAALRL